MRLNCIILPIIIFALFGYGVAKLDQNTADGTQKINVPALEQSVKADGKKVKAGALKAKAEAQEILSHGVPDYSTLNK